MNILDSFARHAQAHPKHLALVSQDKVFSYGQLWATVGSVALALQAHGVRRGERVAVSWMAPPAYLSVVLALAWIGAVSTMARDEKTMPGERDRIMRRDGVTAWVLPAPGVEGAAALVGIRPIHVLDLFNRASTPGALPQLAQGLADEPWRITLSSGTTGESKSIPWTHGQLAALQRLQLDVYPSGPGERLLIFASLALGFSMVHATMQLASGAALVLPLLSSTAAFFAAFDDTRPTRALTTTAVGFDLAAYARKTARNEPLRLSSLLLGGSVLPPNLRRELEQRVCANLRVVYGSTEAGAMAHIDNQSYLANPASAGRAMPWVRAEAVDEADQPLPAGEIGRLRFHSPAMAGEYLGDPEASARAFKSGWYYPGDLGSVDAHRNVFLAGRDDDVINVDGVKVNSAMVRQVLDADPSVIESAVSVVEQSDGRRLLVALVVPKADVDAAHLQRLVEEKFGAVRAPSRILSVEALPRNPAGKVDRKALAVLAAALLGRADSAPQVPAAGNEGEAS